MHRFIFLNEDPFGLVFPQLNPVTAFVENIKVCYNGQYLYEEQKLWFYHMVVYLFCDLINQTDISS